MSTPMIRIHDLETNEVIDREMTEAEYADYLLSVEASELEKSKELEKEAAKAELLNRLGITADEAKLLLS